MIPDIQAKPGVDLGFLSDIGKYIVDKKPDIIVQIGDFFDLPSLSSYDRGTKSFEGRRLQEDLDYGHKAMEEMLKPIVEFNLLRKKNKKALYRPEMHLTLGNHEDRLDRMTNYHPELHGVFGTKKLGLEEYGWNVHPFLRPVNLCGINFVHYLANPMTGRPYGGQVLSQLQKVGQSFVCGHKQSLEIAVRPIIDGSMQIGIIAGACYEHDEEYKGPQGNTHFRGLVMLNEVKDGFGYPMPVSLNYLRKRYRCSS